MVGSCFGNKSVCRQVRQYNICLSIIDAISYHNKVIISSGKPKDRQWWWSRWVVLWHDVLYSRAHAEKEEIVKEVDGVVGMDGWLVPRLAHERVTAVESGSADK